METIASALQGDTGAAHPVPGSSRKDQLALRWQSAAQLYFELGPERSIARLLPAMRERFGSICKRTLSQWSTEDQWVDRALRYDRGHSATALGQNDIQELAKLDTRQAFDTAIKKYLVLAISAPVVIRNEQGLKAVIQTIADLLKARAMLPEDLVRQSEVRRKAEKSSSDDPHDLSRLDAVLAEMEDRVRKGTLHSPQDTGDEASLGTGLDNRTLGEAASSANADANRYH